MDQFEKVKLAIKAIQESYQELDSKIIKEFGDRGIYEGKNFMSMALFDFDTVKFARDELKKWKDDQIYSIISNTEPSQASSPSEEPQKSDPAPK